MKTRSLAAKQKRVVAIVQARTDSSRFPGKVLAPVRGRPVILHLLSRLKQSELLDEVVLVTSTEASDDSLETIVSKSGTQVFRGSKLDVLDRFYQAALDSDAQIVVRVTGDCPLVDPRIVDLLVAKALSTGDALVTNTYPPTFPDGLDVEVFPFTMLESAWLSASAAEEREHVTPYMYLNYPDKVVNIEACSDTSRLRLTLDYPEDLEVIESIFGVFEPDTFFSLDDVLALQKARPELFAENAKFIRNAGLSMTQGQKMWSRAKRIIPGGSMLLSKRPEMYAPDYWPPYFKEARGCHVWDVDGREFVDVSMMGIGTNLLGYGHPEVDEAVRQAVNAGVSSTLNCPEELVLAERLISMHPWASKVRLARTGGEANAIAVRIARAATGKHQIAFCGYHGWHDWYLSANLADGESLDGHLLPGLDPMGVPRGLCGTTFSFPYNDTAVLEALLEEHADIGIVVMEVQRNTPPKPGFLAEVRSIADRNGLVLIFDECTSAFRENFGGLHLKYGVPPDLATFGKALGNGYAITAVIGRSAVMSVAEESFISSTFWTERIGPCAALATLRVMEDTQSWEVVSEIGRYMKRLWTHLIDENSLNAGVGGLDALATLNFESSKALSYKTLISQQLLQSGYLAATSFYASTAHNSEILDAYGESLSKTFDLIRQCEEGRPIDQLLVGPMAHAGFKRLT